MSYLKLSAEIRSYTVSVQYVKKFNHRFILKEGDPKEQQHMNPIQGNTMEIVAIIKP